MEDRSNVRGNEQDVAKILGDLTEREDARAVNTVIVDDQDAHGKWDHFLQ